MSLEKDLFDKLVYDLDRYDRSRAKRNKRLKIAAYTFLTSLVLGTATFVNSEKIARKIIRRIDGELPSSYVEASEYRDKVEDARDKLRYGASGLIMAGTIVPALASFYVLNKTHEQKEYLLEEASSLRALHSNQGRRQ